MSSLGLVPNYVVLVLGKEGRDLVICNIVIRMTEVVGIGSKKASGFEYEYSSNIQLKLFFLYTYVSPKANINK